jgi:7-carboxy-7-deazaguanine synthase (Cx14CxxC type)
MGYLVKEIYFTLQGEGARAGRPALLCRFAGCNLWSGREADRVRAACWFCDTDFVGTDGDRGGRFSSAAALVSVLEEAWRQGDVARRARLPRGFGADLVDRADTDERVASARRYVVFTGGEPLLQLDARLVELCHEHGFEVAVETNGTIAAPDGIDWLTVSPKPDADLVQRSGDELKLVFPHRVTPDSVVGLDFRFFYLQPLDGVDRDRNTALALAYCRAHPTWRLGLQAHKLIGMP